MKRVVLASLIGVLLVAGCGKKQEAVYQKGSKEYEFFKQLSEKLPLVDPDKKVTLIKTNQFVLTNADIMPQLYSTLSGHMAQLTNVSGQQLMEFLKQTAVRESQRRMFLAAAKEQKITVPEDSIQNELKAIYTMFGGKPNFEEQLAKRGETLDDVKKQIEENLILQKYFDTVVYKDVNVTEEELRDAYEKGSTATVQHILLLTQGKSEEEKAAIYKKMEEILKRAKAGEDFGELAKEFSEDPGSKNRGGLYEDFPRGQMVKEFEEAAFNLPVGSISDIIETEYGYHIMKILNRKKDERPYEKAKEDIRNALLRAKKRDITVALLDSLKKKYEYEELFDQVG